MRDFKDAFEEVGNQAGTNASSARADEYVSSVEDAINKACKDILDVGKTYHNNPDHSVKGFVAEAHHAGTYNIDAARQELSARAAERLSSNLPASSDIRVHGPSGTVDWQLKYLKTPEDGAKGLSHPGYAEMGKVAPADHLGGIRDAATARAERIAGHRPEQAAQLHDTAQRVTDRISKDGCESRPLTSHEALDMAREVKHGDLNHAAHGFTTEHVIQLSDVGHHAAQGAASAAIVTAAVRVAPHIWRAIEVGIKEGRFSTEDLAKAAREGGHGAVQGALRGAVAGGIVTACQAGLLGEAAKSLDPSGIGAATAVAISTIGNAVRLSKGEITGAEFADRCGRNVVAATAGVVGAGIGQTLIPVPVLGAVVGNLVGSVIGTVGYEGAAAAISTAENREGWEAQVGLAEAIGRLAETVQVVNDNAQIMVVIHGKEVEALRAASTNWARQSATIQDKLRAMQASTADIRERTKGQQDRVARLRAASEKQRG